MRIGFILDDSLDKTDGVQQYVLTLGGWLNSQGHEVHYLAGSTRRNDLSHLHSLSSNVQVHFNENRMSTPFRANNKKIKQVLNNTKFDVLHVQMPYSPLLAGKIIKQAGEDTAVIGTFHIVPFSWKGKIGLRLLNSWQIRNRRRLDKIFAVSKPALRYAKKMGRSKALILPNMIDFKRYSKAEPIKKYRDGKMNIVFLGRLVERKGCLNLLMALEELHKKRYLTNVRVLICGKGPLKPALENFVKQKHLGSVVKFVGYVDEQDKARYLASADIAVFPSTGGESFGIVLLEAMAAGSDVVLAGNNEGYSWVMNKTK